MATQWHGRPLTTGTADGQFHQHAYYDIPVFDDEERYVAVHRLAFQGRQPTPTDEIEIGIVDLADGDRWIQIGRSTAWSWQQGAHSMFLPGTRTCVWNVRRGEGDEFGADTYDLESGTRASFARPVYATSRSGEFLMSLNMARLNACREGYGYATARSVSWPRAPEDDGVWRMEADSGRDRLVLSLAEARTFLFSHLGLKERIRHIAKRYHYWFNHIKLSADDKRFTVKLRWKQLGQGWSDIQGISLIANSDGSGDLSFLDRGTSHVMWLGKEKLFYWRKGGVRLAEFNSGRCRDLGAFAPGILDHNVHMVAVPGEPGRFIYDTPYREEIGLLQLEADSRASEIITTFSGHTPARGPFRCDLHPAISSSGRKFVITTLQDGGRQVHLFHRD